MTSPGHGPALVSLLHLCDSLFPLGGFAHSDGLEVATSSGAVSTAGDLRAWMDAGLAETLGRCEGAAVSQAWRAVTDGRYDRIVLLDDEVYALRPSSTARQASRSMGGRLLKTWRQLRGPSGLDAVPGPLVTLPVAFGCVCAASGIDERAAVEGFCYTRLAATISSAMRLMAIGQHEAHALLADVLVSVPAIAGQIVDRREAPMAFMPALDLAAMSQQYVHSRLFRS